jgi:uncharacterized repeat protein (TIGR01451 family)
MTTYHPNQKFLGVQNPFFKKGFGRRRHQQASGPNYRQSFLFVLFVLMASFGLLAQSTGITGDSTINRCETKSYTISIQNNSGNPLTNIVVTGELGNIPDFSYVSGSSSIDVNGGGAFCTANPTPSGNNIVWNINAACGSFTLNNGDTLNVTFSLSTNCTAVSGSLNTTINYDISGAPSSDTGVLNIQVNPGAVTIKKTDPVIPQVLGSNVTWTLTVENTGFGIIENVEITDTLGAGLAYVSSTESGNNSGQVTTWTSAEFAALASMDPGDILTMDITAQVIACDNLENVADVRFGCDPSPTNTCFDTSIDGGTANASVQRIVRTPLIGFTPPDVTFDYCDDVKNVAFTITNTGDGIAYNVWTIIDFTGFTVSNVSAGAVYNVGQTRFELADPLAASGGNYNLSFDLTYTGWCGGTFPSGDLLWQKLYEDECAQQFYPPVELSSMNAPASSTSLTVSKSGAPSQIEIGGTITYTITSSYSGPLNCDSPSGSTGLITVVDTIPNGLTVTDAGGGVWVPGGGGTGGTITWTYTPPASLNTTITVQIPDVTQCEAFCNTVFTNTISASGTDCCGCALSANDSQTTAIECAEGVTSDKTSSSPTERCADTTYTNTYVFSGGSGVNLNDLVFTELAENQQVYNGNLSILLNGGPVAGVALNDTTPGGTVELDFSGAAATPLAGSTLVISYDLTATTNTIAACGGNTFYSWSSLDMGPAGSSCLGDGVIHETTEVNIGSPSMSVSVSGLGQIFHTCETKQIDIVLTQTSNFNPKDVKLVLSGLNYFVVNPGSVTCTGAVSPVSCNPVIDGSGNYVWTFNDVFTANGTSATITLNVQKRCTGGGDLVATAYFDDRCTDDATPDELCSAVGSETPALLLKGDLLIEKTPETYYAATNTVVWEIYVTNRGTGTAYNVWVDDLLGTGLTHNNAVVDDMTGVTVTAGQDHDGNVNAQYTTISIADMTAGERRQITLTADVVDCNNLTNDVTANWGCVGVECQTDVTDNSLVQIPAPNLINTNTITPAGGVDACESPKGFITLRNAGQVNCYNLQVTETLPTNLTYVSGTTRWRLNGGAWNGPNVIYDPSPTTSPLVWSKTEIPGLASADSGDTIEIEFDMTSDCPFTGGDITCATQYENPCADVFNTSNSTFSIVFNEPDVTVTKTRADVPIGCNEAVSWTIDVTNNSGYTLPIIWVEDTLDAAYTWTSHSDDNTFCVDNGFRSGQTVQWELKDVPHGTTVTLTLNADTDSSPCSSDLDNTVDAWWGCGVTDDDSSTKPGVDEVSLCLNATSIQDVRTETRQPDLGYLTIAMTPSSIDSCDDSTTLTVVLSNTGPTDASNVDLQITLPAGLTYNTGTSESGLGTDDTVGTAGIGDPAISGSTLTWFDVGDKGNNLANTIQADGGNDTLVLKFAVQSACYTTDNLGFNLRYYDCCDDTQYSTTDQQSLTALFPSLAITKTPTTSQVACAGQQSWTITVTNNGTGDAQVIRVEDTPGAWIDVDIPSSTAGLTDMGGGVYGWETNNVVKGGGTAVFTLVGTLNPDAFPNQNDCTTSLRQNNVQAVWACGTIGDAIDNDPTTTTNYDCTDSTPVSAPVATLRLPNLVVTDIDPTVSCTSDGSFSGTIDVDIQNTGDGATSGTFTVQVSDGKGWTGTGTHTTAIAAGGTATVTINTGSWTPGCQTCGGGYDFTAVVDLNNDICECNETDNGFTDAGNPYDPPIPELSITDIDFTNVSCSADGISGNVRVQVSNTGCATASNFQVALATDGCLTFTPQTVASLGASSSAWRTFTISGNWADCTDATCDFTATVDAPTAVCECDGTNNTRTETFTSTLPDLVVTDIDFTNISCAGDNISGTVDVTVQNQGFGSATGFEVSLSSVCGVTFSNVTAGATLTNGQSTTVTLTVAGSLSNCGTCSCNFTATVDATNVICECDGTNNTRTEAYTNPLPNLRVLSVTPTFTCTADGTLSGNVAVVVDNNGCGNAGSIPVQLTSTGSYTFTDQNVTLAQGNSTTLNFAFTPTSANCDVNFTATIDPSNTICECTGSDNSDTYNNFTPIIPDLSITDIDFSNVTCVSDNISGNVRVTVQNSGCGTANNFQVALATDGCLTFTPQSVVSLNDSSSTVVTFNISGSMADCTDGSCDFTATVDGLLAVCEFDGTNNARTETFTNPLPDLIVTDIDFTNLSCSTDALSGSVDVTVQNQGHGSATGFQVTLTGSTLTFTPENVAAVLTNGQSTTVTLNVATAWNNSATCNADFTATVDALNAVCECNGSNNTRLENYAHTLPKLNVTSVTPSASCTSDGNLSGTVTVNVSNSGCGNANAVTVRLISDCGLTFSDQTINLTQGSNQDVTFNYTPVSSSCTCTFTASVDPNDTICESSNTNHSLAAAPYTLTLPDLLVQSDTLAISCSTDGNISVSGNLTLQNDGCGSNFTTDIPVRFTLYDNTGCSGNVLSTWTETFSSVNMASGSGTQAFTISAQSITSNMVTNSTGCQVSIGVELDHTNTICEYDGSNNSYCANNKAIDIPDVEVSADTLGVSCTTDGNVSVTGNVTLINNGCGSNLASDVPMRFTLYNGTGCSGTVLSTWTQTFSSVNMAASGGTQAFALTPQAVAANLAVAGCQVSIGIEADYSNTVCESDGTDNTYCADNIAVDIPDLELQSNTLVLTGTGDGTAEVNGNLTVVNNGCGSNMTTDIPVRITVFDNINCTGNQITQWTETLSSANIPAGGGTQTFTITTQNLTGNYCTGSTGCQVSMRVELDYSTTICESDGTDNDTCVNKTVNIPDLSIDSVGTSITCLSDGSLTGTTVTVRNEGCVDAVNVVVRLASDCGLSFPTDQTVDIAAGTTEDVFFAFNDPVTSCTCNFTATVDPDDAIDECDGTNNTATSATPMIIPDIEMQSDALVVTCADDGLFQVSGTITLANQGCGANLTTDIPMRFTLYGGTGGSGSQVAQWTETLTAVNIATGGGTQTFTIQTHDINTSICNLSSNCQLSITMDADFGDTICEWDGTNNSLTTDKTNECYDLEAVELNPNITCTDDGSFDSNLTLTLRNSGATAIASDFYIQVDDGQGWTRELRYRADLGGTLPLNPGVSRTIDIPWDRTVDTTTCDFSAITVTLDSRDQYCQCSSENDVVTTSFVSPYPNLKPTLIEVDCSADGFYNATVTVQNDGCADWTGGSFVVRLTDDQGNTRDVTVSLGSLSKGATTIVEFTEWPATCDSPTVNFTADVDVNSEVCEINGNDNSLSYEYIKTSPDMVITSVTPVTSMSAPGEVKGSFKITVTNQGNGPLNSDFKVTCNDGEGWTTERFYQANLGGSLPVAAGASVSLNVPWTRKFTKEPFTCDFNNISVGIDTETGVCECSAGNNETVVSYKLPYPDLTITSLAPTCKTDGMQQLDIVVGNQGCDDQSEDFNIIFTDSSATTQTVPFTQLGGTLPVKAGTTQFLSLPEWPIDCSNATTEYTATIDPTSLPEDLVATNNSYTHSHTFSEPDLTIEQVDWDCGANGNITFTVLVVNNGRSTAGTVPVTVYDENNSLIHTENVDLPTGESKQFTFSSGPYATGKDISFRFVVDEDNQVCECDGTNNDKTVTFLCKDDGGGGGEGGEGGEEPEILELVPYCSSGQQPGGLFRFELKFQNNGKVTLYNIRVVDLVPEGFQYVTDSATYGGQKLEPSIQDQWLTWDIGNLGAGETATIVFSGVADIDIKPGRYCNEAHAGGNSGSDTGIEIVSQRTVCCTTVTPQTSSNPSGSGCCLDVEEFPMSPFRRPDGPVSFIEPYFHTESAMFTVYSIFNLWQDKVLEKGSMPRFMKERLQNYARSTMEEFYFGSSLGLTLDDGSLWLSYGGAYPEKDNKDKAQHRWIRKSVDKTVTVSQLAFELLALNETIKTGSDESVKQKLTTILEKKLSFLNHSIEELPHGWQIDTNDKEIGINIFAGTRKLNSSPTLYDKTSLFLAMTELKLSGYNQADTLLPKVREMLITIDDKGFDLANKQEEFLFITALLKAGENDQAKAKMKGFKKIFATEEHEGTQTKEEEENSNITSIADYGMALYLIGQTGDEGYDALLKQLEDKFYLKDTGIFAEKQPDFTFKLTLRNLAPLLLAFGSDQQQVRMPHNATVMYRTFDEVGLFLKKRNLQVGKPLYSILKNYPYSEPVLPVLTFTKANRTIAPVFSREAVVHSTQLKPIGEVLIPGSYSKVLSPGYETKSNRIASLSFGLQYVAQLLAQDQQQVIKEEGRSFASTGRKYFDSLRLSGAGYTVNGNVLVPFDNVAIKGPKKDQHNLEPLNAGIEFSTETLVNYMLSGKLYVTGKGKNADTVAELLKTQTAVLEKLMVSKFISSRFSLLIDGDEITVIPTKEKAGKITIAKILHLMAHSKAAKFLTSHLNNTEGSLVPEDLLFLSTVPELSKYFEIELKAVVDLKDAKVSHNAADIIGRRLLGADSPDTSEIQRSLENLKKHWDKESVWLKSDQIETIEKGLIYHHDPNHFILYLLATNDVKDFRFKRTLNFFTYLLENEWGVAWDSEGFITLPSSEYQVFKEEPREKPEPGDLINFRVRIDNTCPTGFGTAYDLSSLIIKSGFTPNLVYTGTQRVDGLEVVNDFLWRYNGFPEGTLLEYIYQAYVPQEFTFGFVDGRITVSGRRGFSGFGLEESTGDDCDDIDHIQRLNILPFEQLQGLIYEDRNVNGIKDAGEPGIANILVKDTRGRLFRSDADGHFVVLAGNEHEGVQLELKSLPPHYLLLGNPTMLVNRNYTGKIHFGLVPSKTVVGFVYVDANGNGQHDPGETAPAGVVLKAKDKEVLTGKGGQFIFRNLPELWQQWIEIKKDQPFYNDTIDNLKINK